MGSGKPSNGVDFGYLEDFAAGDLGVVREVLELFVGEAETWRSKLESASGPWRDVVHTMKGASRGVGAFALGDLCAAAEAEGDAGLSAVRAGLDAAVAEVEAYLAAA